MMSFLMLATAGKVTLGVLVCLLGLMGLVALALSGWWCRSWCCRVLGWAGLLALLVLPFLRRWCS